MHFATAGGVVRVMRPLLASALFALGSSFALVALHGGDSILAAAMLMTACSTAAVLVRVLGASQLVDNLADARHVARDR
jgi:RNase P/RNase MRP subunit POP5